MTPRDYRRLRPTRRLAVCALVALVGMIAAPCRAEPPSAQAPSDTQESGKSADLEGLLNLPIEQLAKTPIAVPSMDIPVTSVTKACASSG